jgi:hypothetical protein
MYDIIDRHPFALLALSAVLALVLGACVGALVVVL